MDEQYFKIIYIKYFHILYLFPLRIVHNPEAAKDIVQDVCASCWIKHCETDCSLPMKLYLYKHTYNLCLDFLKLPRNKNIVLIGETYKLENMYYSSFTINEEFYIKEINREINSCLCSLSMKCKKTFQLRKYYRLRSSKISKKLNISNKTIEKILLKPLIKFIFIFFIKVICH